MTARAGPRGRGVWIALALWLAFIAGCVAVIARTDFRTDFSAFLPSQPTAAQQLLVEQLKSGAGSSTLLVGIKAANGDAKNPQATTARLSALSGSLAQRLREERAFIRVLNGETTDDSIDQKLLFDHRYLLSPMVDAERFTAFGLRDAVQDSIAEIASASGLLVKDLLPRDPTGEMLAIVDRMLPSGGGPAVKDGHWFNDAGNTALLLVQTRAGGDDIDGQQDAIARIQAAYHAALASVGPSGATGVQPALLVSGPGKFAVASRDSIKSAVERLSLVGSVLILSLLYAIYRSVTALLLGVLPVVSGVLAGIAAVSLGFGTVHGITLGFGATLVGEAVDYAIYLFVQRGGGGAGDGSARATAEGYSRNFWPTIRLGVLTSICGFSALLLSGFPGLAQLGLFSIAGIASAAVVTRWLLPRLLPASFQVRNTSKLGARLARLIAGLRHWRWPALALVTAALALLAVRHADLWNHELLALSPVPIEAQQLDARLRADMGAPDVRFLVVVRGASAQDALQRCERLIGALDDAVASGLLGGWEAPCKYLPSVKSQLQRRAALPADAQLRERMTKALAGQPLRIETIEPFFADVAAARQAEPLSLADVRGASFAAALDATLTQVKAADAGNNGQAHWNALVQLRAPAASAATTGLDDAKLRQRLEPLLDADTVLLDLKGASDDLYRDYMSQALRLSGIGLLAIVLVLSFSLRSARRVTAVCLPLFAAVALVAAGLHLGGVRMNLLHLVGLLLTVAVGSNYALFFDAQSQPDQADTRIYASLLFASMTTMVGFGVLAFSDVPVLSAIGITVGPGALCALVFSAILSSDRRTTRTTQPN